MATIECVRQCNYNNVHFAPTNWLGADCDRQENHARLWVQLWRKMLLSRTFWRIGSCVFAFCLAQGYAQTPAASSASQAPVDHSAPAPTTPGTDNKTPSPVIPGLSTLPTSQAGPP